MILAAGLTPAWQQILLFDRFEPGEVNRAREAHWCASGKVLNVGIAAHALGAPCKTLAMIGGRGGDEIRREFTERSIDARWIDSATPTRVCTTILEAGSPRTTELVENSAAPSSKELQEFVAAYKEEAASAGVVVLTGSLPQGVPPTFYRELLEATRCRAVLDVRGTELLEALPCRPFLVKPNREELGKTFGRDLMGDGAAVDALRQTIELGAEWVILTDGSRPTLIASAQGVYRATPPAATVVNPIGCGDCLAAGIAVALAEGRPPLDAIRFGLAAAADNLPQLLPARLERNVVEAMAARIAPPELLVH